MNTATVQALAAEAPGPDGHRQIVRLAVNAVATARGLIVDLTPEGKQPPVQTRIFPGVALPLCAAIFTRRAGPCPETLAAVHIATVNGRREDKYRQVERLLGIPQGPDAPS